MHSDLIGGYWSSMLKIKIIPVGKLKEKFYIEACKEYIKRLEFYCKIEIKELPEGGGLAKEAELIKSELIPGSFVIAMCIEGKLHSSEELAAVFQRVQNQGKSAICVLLGSSEGMDESVKALADLRLSMSKMTFPHHLARVMVLEQIYRAMNINGGGKYHK